MKSLYLLLFASLLLPFGCSAQSNPQNQAQTALNRRIENKVRSITDVPASVKVAIGNRTSSEYAGWDKLPITFSGAGGKQQTVEFLISKDNAKLARFNTFDLAADPMTKIDVAGRPVRGNANAKVTIVNFDDFQCPYCARMHEVLTDDILKTYGNEVKIIYKDFPLISIHPWAKRAAMTANCLASQNANAFWDFADYVHGHPRDISAGGTPTVALTKLAFDIATKDKLDSKKLDACLKSDDDAQVVASMQEGDSLGVSATPTMFINGEKVEGAMPPSELHAVINRALIDAGQPVPAAAQAAASAPDSAEPSN